MKLIYEHSRPGRRAGRVPDYGLPKPELPAELRRARPPRLPEVSEPELVRHITALADRNFGIDTGFYPLGTCTMKHNPRINERVGQAARLPRPASASGGRRRAGCTRAAVAAAGDPEGDRGAARDHAAAGRRVAGRADRADADARLLRGSRRGRAARHDRHRRHRSRHEPGERDDGRATGSRRWRRTSAATSISTTCARR